MRTWRSGDTLADRFLLETPIGEGGMGRVWRAMHTRFEAPVAIKLIDADDADASSRFLREARACAAVRGPNVVEVLDLGVEEGTPYLAMELLSGRSLAACLRDEGRLSPAATLGVIEQAARGIARAHRRGIVHRDLKPSNLHLVPDEDDPGSAPLVKVLDFGIAKVLSDNDRSLTATGAVLGTPQYMSPEQLRGTRALDHRSDLFSLAIVAFECLVGRPPVESRFLSDVVVAMATQPLPKPSSLNPALPAAVDAWFARATRRAPDERFDDAASFVEGLRSALGRSSASRATSS